MSVKFEDSLRLCLELNHILNQSQTEETHETIKCKQYIEDGHATPYDLRVIKEKQESCQKMRHAGSGFRA